MKPEQVTRKPKPEPVPPMTTAEMARLIGMSPTFIREEIHGGHLRALVFGHGRKRVFRIPVQEVRRYLKQLGVL